MAPENDKIKKLHHVEFKFAGQLPDGRFVTVAIRCQYEAVEIAHNSIVYDVHQAYGAHQMVLASQRNWQDEAQRALMASFFRNRLLRRNAVADKMYDQGNFSLTMEVIGEPTEELKL